MVWRGTWQCSGCAVRGGLLVDGTSTPSRLPREALAGVPIFSSSEGNNSTTQRQTWLAAVESLTSMHRRTVAAVLRRRGTRLAVAVDEWEGERAAWVADELPATRRPSGEVVARAFVSKWHEQRVDGQAQRFERVAQCGTYEYALDVTQADGTVVSKPLRKRCDCWRVCPRCLNRRKWKLAEGMKRQRAEARRVLGRKTHPRYKGGGEGTWSEKLITFTVPHGAGGPSEDARCLVDAWQLMLRKIRTHLVDRGCIEVVGRGDAATASDGDNGKSTKKRRARAASVPWNRALEVATQGEHHAHMHVWWFGPYLESALLQVWWGQILDSKKVAGLERLTWNQFLEGRRQTGHTPDRRLASWLGNPPGDKEFPWGIVDIRGEKQGDGALAAYTQKVGISLYVTKGTETSALEPAHAASIYEVFEGTRAVQWARGWAPPKVPLKAVCVSFRRLTEEEKSQLNRSAISAQNKGKNAEKPDEKAPTVLVSLPDTSGPPALASARLLPVQLALDMNTT